LLTLFLQKIVDQNPQWVLLAVSGSKMAVIKLPEYSPTQTMKAE